MESDLRAKTPKIVKGALCPHQSLQISSNHRDYKKERFSDWYNTDLQNVTRTNDNWFVISCPSEKRNLSLWPIESTKETMTETSLKNGVSLNFLVSRFTRMQGITRVGQRDWKKAELTTPCLRGRIFCLFKKSKN